MATCKAAVLVRPGGVEMVEYPVPEIGVEDALVATTLSGICGTDLHVIKRPPENYRLPLIRGHEMCGRIIALGSSANDTMRGDGPFSVGDRVAVFPASACGRCWWDQKFGENQSLSCEHPLIYGVQNCSEPPHLFGGWSEYLYIRPRTWMFKIPDSLPDEVAVLAEPFSIAIRAVERGMTLPSWKNEQTLPFGGTVAVLGSGPIGLLTAIAARLAGAGRIILVGAPRAALTLAQELGVADEVVDVMAVGAQDRIERVRALTERGVGADLVFETAGVPAAFVEGLEMLRKMGTFVEVGCLIDTGETAAVNIGRLITTKDVNLFGIASQPPQTMMKALQTLELTNGRIDYRRLVTAQFDIGDVPDAIRLAQDPVMKGIKIVLRGAGYQRGGAGPLRQ